MQILRTINITFALSIITLIDLMGGIKLLQDISGVDL